MLNDFFENIDIKNRKLLMYFGIIALSLHNFFRLFDQNLWGDEGIVVDLARRKTLFEMLKGVVEYGHSPFHYTISWIATSLFGESFFLYHLVASIPYFIIIVICLSVVSKWFNRSTAFLLIIFDTLLDGAVVYNLEVRMYAWCQLFIFLTYLVAYRLFASNANRIRNLVLLAVFSALAIYSHYFAAACVGIIYAILFIHALFYNGREDRNGAWKLFLSGIFAVILLVPWITFVLRISHTMVRNYSLSPVSWRECIEYIFHLKLIFLSYILLAIFTLTFVLRLVLYRTSEEEKCPGEIWWLISGVIAVFGTIGAAQLYSSIKYPIICLRYLYPSYIIIWLIFALNISRMKRKHTWMAIALVCVLMCGYPKLIYNMIKEYRHNKELKRTLSITQPRMTENSVIYTDLLHFAWTVEAVYYPDTPNNLIGHSEWWGTDELPKLDDDKENWLFLGEEISSSLNDEVTAQGYEAVLLDDHGFIGTGNTYWIYELIRNE